MTIADEPRGPPVPPLSADQVRVLRAWCEREPGVEKAWIYGSHVRGWRYDPTKTGPSDIDLAVARNASRASLSYLKASLEAYLAPQPALRSAPCTPSPAPHLTDPTA